MQAAPSKLSALLFAALAFGCGNNPYGEFPTGRVFFTSMEETPTTLDPGRVQDMDSAYIASNIHDAPYNYHYLLRPLRPIPAMATALPEIGERRRNGRAYYALRFSIKRNLRYADDECFPGGRGRAINIDDIILPIKRAADDAIQPFGKPFFEGALLGFDEFNAALARARTARSATQPLSLADDPLYQAYLRDIPGVVRLDDYSVELLFEKPAPQSFFFFAMPSSSPVPLECVFYYDGKIRPSYSRRAVASGPFRVAEWREDHLIRLEKNPNYRRDDFYPTEGEPGDDAAGLLERAGRPLPMLDEVRIYIIRRAPPKWALFGQGYLDLYRNRLDLQERLVQSAELQERYREYGVRRTSQTEFSTFGWVFNMRGALFGKNLELRRAIALLIDREELIRLFLPGRAQPAMGLLPPEFPGYDPEYKNIWARGDLNAARRHLRLAGYPNGVDPATGKPLEIQLFDRAAQGRAAVYRYYIDRFAAVGLRLKVEQVDFPSLIRIHNSREFNLVHWGWGADYPDPETFLQLFYSPNISNTYNVSQYANAEYDRLYEQMRATPAGPERARQIRAMHVLLERDLPVVLFFHRQGSYFTQPWTAPVKPNPLDLAEMKHWDVEPERRAAEVARRNALGGPR